MRTEFVALSGHRTQEQDMKNWKCISAIISVLALKILFLPSNDAFQAKKTNYFWEQGFCELLGLTWAILLLLFPGDCGWTLSCTGVPPGVPKRKQVI